jgi:transcriptional regulator with GAF, ATPase, and Fis domain
LTLEALRLLAQVDLGAGRSAEAREHLDEAIALRDRIAASLPDAMRSSYFTRPDRQELTKVGDDRLASDKAMSRSDPPRGASSGEARPLVREIVGRDPAIRALLAAIPRVARSRTTVLIRGESGTGKELVAGAIHRASDRRDGSLVTVNCAALVDTLLLSELFGHEKGAFTGAVARHRGRFELAASGTLFLDEIGDISTRTQVALLRVLQDGSFERVGGTTSISADVRVVCATHRDLRALVERGEFREDLYYRLRGITLEVPPLRARLGDLPYLAAHLLERIAAERRERPKTLSADAMEVLRTHRWPGNVRELENALRAASLFAEGDTITGATLVESAGDLAPRTVRVADAPHDGRGAPAGGRAVSPGPLPSSDGPAAIAYSQVRGGALSLPKMKRTIERECIARALAETRGNIARAALLLGMKRPRVSQLVREYGLAIGPSDDRDS